MSPPTKSRIKAQQDRQSSQDLLQVYGSLLTPKQYAMTAGYSIEGKSFSQIAREQGVSRQAVHEAVRGVQRLLKYYEDKLKLKAEPRGQQSRSEQQDTTSSASVTDAVNRLESLRNKVIRKGIIYTPDWIVQEISDTIQMLEEEASLGKSAPAAKPAKAPAKAVAKPAKPPAKAAAKPAKAPAKAVAKPVKAAAKPVAKPAKAPAKAVAKPAKAPAKAVAKQVKSAAKAVAKPVKAVAAKPKKKTRAS